MPQSCLKNVAQLIIVVAISWARIYDFQKYFRQKLVCFVQNTANLCKNCIIASKTTIFSPKISKNRSN
jgi:hypothetical protein